MAEVIYHVVEHDGGWAYKVGDVYSGVFATHAEARQAATEAAARQEQPGTTGTILYEDAEGKWHREIAERSDRPQTAVEDDAPADDNDEPKLSSLTGAMDPVHPDGKSRGSS